MNRNDLFRAMECIDDQLIENSEVKMSMKHPGRFSKKTLLLAAMLCLLLAFATVAVATRFFSLRDTLVETNDPEIKNEMSLSGFTDSNEYLAATEWKAFVDSYDPDGTLLAQADPEGPDDVVFGEQYAHYTVYTQAMADKLDEIAAKYSLTLYSGYTPDGLDATVEKLFVNEQAEFSDAAYNTMLAGYMFADGTFSYDGVFDAASGRLSVDYQFRRSVKGVLDPIFLNIGDIEDYQEQVLVTGSGIEFTAAVSATQSILISEFDSCFVTINVMGGTDMGVTFADLEDLVNTFDLSVITGAGGAAAQDQP